MCARYRHVALGLRGAAQRAVPPCKDRKRDPRETESQSEQRAEINEPAFSEATAGRCGASGGFFFHGWDLGLCERILEESRRSPPSRCAARWMLWSGDFKMQEKPF